MHMSATAVINWLIGLNSGKPRTEIPFRGELAVWDQKLEGLRTKTTPAQAQPPPPCSADLVMYIVLSSTSLIAVNTSLALNTVGQYQVRPSERSCSSPAPALQCNLSLREALAPPSLAFTLSECPRFRR